MAEPRYWSLTPDAGPGDAIARSAEDHGPGNYQVVVRTPGKPIQPSDAPWRNAGWVIELWGTLARSPVRFNPGMARWFGLRLIEAAALYEQWVDDQTRSAEPSPRWGEVQEWMHDNAADYLVDVPAGDSIVPAVLKLLADAKQALADLDLRRVE